MARSPHGIEKSIRLYAENSDSNYIDMLFGATAPGGDSGEQDAASVGSIYMRTGAGGGLYKKVVDNNALADWEEVGNVALDELVWRSEKVVAGTNDTLSAGSGINPVSWTDNDSGVDATNWVVGNHVLGDLNGVPALFRISAIDSATSITLVAASIAIADNNTFMVQAYLPDSPASQEQQAIVHIPTAGSPAIKISDINWNFADGISLAASYAQTNGTVTSADTVNSAIQKLDGNQIDLITLSGVAQGAVDLGAFTGTVIADNQTVKQALQALETAVEAGSPTYTSNAVTTAVTVDSVLVDNICAVKWYVYARETANPERVKAYEVWATHNGTPSADATQSDDTVYAKLKIGSNFDVNLSVDVNGTGAGQTMRLRVSSSSAGVDVRATREAVSF